MAEALAALACLAARFSFRDFPDFLVMVCRGDLSDIAGPLIMGAWLVPIPRPYPFLVWASGPQMVSSRRGYQVWSVVSPALPRTTPSKLPRRPSDEPMRPGLQFGQMFCSGNRRGLLWRIDGAQQREPWVTALTATKPQPLEARNAVVRRYTAIIR